MPSHYIDPGKTFPSYNTTLAIINVFGMETYNNLVDFTGIYESE